MLQLTLRFVTGIVYVYMTYCCSNFEKKQIHLNNPLHFQLYIQIVSRFCVRWEMYSRCRNTCTFIVGYIHKLYWHEVLDIAQFGKERETPSNYVSNSKFWFRVYQTADNHWTYDISIKNSFQASFTNNSKILRLHKECDSTSSKGHNIASTVF